MLRTRFHADHQQPDEWTEIFSFERLTGALLDLITHHVHILEMNADSHRLKQSRRKRVRPTQSAFPMPSTLYWLPSTPPMTPVETSRGCAEHGRTDDHVTGGLPCMSASTAVYICQAVHQCN